MTAGGLLAAAAVKPALAPRHPPAARKAISGVRRTFAARSVGRIIYAMLRQDHA